MFEELDRLMSAGTQRAGSFTCHTLDAHRLLQDWLTSERGPGAAERPAKQTALTPGALPGRADAPGIGALPDGRDAWLAAQLRAARDRDREATARNRVEQQWQPPDGGSRPWESGRRQVAAPARTPSRQLAADGWAAHPAASDTGRSRRGAADSPAEARTMPAGLIEQRGARTPVSSDEWIDRQLALAAMREQEQVSAFRRSRAEGVRRAAGVGLAARAAGAVGLDRPTALPAYPTPSAWRMRTPDPSTPWL